MTQLCGNALMAAVHHQCHDSGSLAELHCTAPPRKRTQNVLTDSGAQGICAAKSSRCITDVTKTDLLPLHKDSSHACTSGVHNNNYFPCKAKVIVTILPVFNTFFWGGTKGYF